MLSSKSTPAIAVCLIGLTLLFAGCESFSNFEEINSNPNDPAEAPSRQILSGLLANFSYQVAGNEAVRVPSLWVQQVSENADPPNNDTYQYQTADPNNLWTFWLYSGVLKDARVLQEAAREEENFATVGIGQLIEAWGWMITADLFGDIPVQEAFRDNEITNPSYDNQEVAYDTLFAKLERARQNLNEGNDVPLGGEDLLYGGNIQKWLSLAWALEAKAHIHLTESGYGAGLDGSSSRQARAQAALSATQNAFPNGNADNAAFTYPGGEDAENPWYQFTIQGVWVTTHQLSANYISLLKGQEDPRLGIQARQVGMVDAANSPPTAGADTVRVPFDPSTHFDPADDTYLGHVNGAGAAGDENVSSIGTYYSAPDAPLIWMNYAEVKFIEAEARAITGTGSAAQAYEDGIRASLDQLNVTSLAGVDQAFVNDFVSDRMAEYNNASNKIREIIEEKYIANFIGLEPFNDWRRTGYPELTPVADSVAATEGGVIPRRFPYPESEYNNNSNEVPTDLGQGVNALDAPVGWDPQSQ